jgi:putative nucleotidyltransferase-like protein
VRTSRDPIALDPNAAALSLRDLAASFLLPDAQPTWPPGGDVSAFLASAATDGVVGLLYARVHASGAAPRLPPALVEGLRTGAHRRAGTEMAQRLELQRLVAAIRTRGLDVLLMKGSSLAYDVYLDPAWRVRSDVDMLIRAGDADGVRSLLRDLGYVSFAALSGEFAISQFHYERVAAPGIRHLCDVHWKIVNRLRLADAIRFDELAAAAIPLPMLGPGARGLGRVHALWLACVHRAVHHYDQDTLLWLYDVHLLIEALDTGGLERFVALAERSGVRRICLRALRLAQTRFATRIPPAVLTALEAAPADEPSTVFLNPNIRQIDVVRDDLRALRGWRARVMLLREHVFPDATYMRQTYAPGSSAPVLWLYLGRIVSGARKWLSSPGEVVR